MYTANSFPQSVWEHRINCTLDRIQSSETNKKKLFSTQQPKGQQKVIGVGLPVTTKAQSVGRCWSVFFHTRNVISSKFDFHFHKISASSWRSKNFDSVAKTWIMFGCTYEIRVTPFAYYQVFYVFDKIHEEIA